MCYFVNAPTCRNLFETPKLVPVVILQSFTDMQSGKTFEWLDTFTPNRWGEVMERTWPPADP